MSSRFYSVKKKREGKGDVAGPTVTLKNYNRLSTKKKKKTEEEEGDSAGSRTHPNRLSSNIKMKKLDSTGPTGSRKDSNRLSGIKKIKIKKKKKKPARDTGRAEVEFKLGLGTYWTSPLESATMLDVSTWSLENRAPLIPEYLPHAFLRRLWLLSPEARSPCCRPPDAPGDTMGDGPGVAPGDTPGEEMADEPGHDSECAVNPLDLVTAVYMSANSFLQQEMTVRMTQCQFAVPLILPAIIPEQSCFLLWPLRAVVSQWRPHLAKTKRVLEGDLASTEMPMVSCVKLGHCSVSKSRVLSRVIGGPGSHNETFLHRGMEGGQLHRKLSNGLVELGWSLPSGDPDRDVFPVPVVISNLRGDAAAHEKCLNLLCRASSVLVVFCGIVREKEKRLLASWKGVASKLILIDIEEEHTRRDAEFLPLSLGEEIGLPNDAVLSGGAVSEEELADRLRRTLNDLLADGLTHVTLQAAADIAVQVGMCLDEGAVCRKAMDAADEVLRDLEHGSAQFRERQLPLQGALWSRLAELDKEESKQIRSGEGVDMQLRLEKRGIVHAQSSYKMTAAMKVFTDALFTTDKIERTFFLNWMKLRLRARQMRQCIQTHERQEESAGPSQGTGEVTNGTGDGPEDPTVNLEQEFIYSEEQTEENSLETNLSYQTERIEKGPLDSVHDVEEQADLDLRESTGQNVEPGVVEEEVITPGPESLNVEEVTENSGQYTDIFGQQSEQGLKVEPIVDLHVTNVQTVKDDLESMCTEERTENKQLDPNVDQIDQNEKELLDPLLAEQVRLSIEESAEKETELAEKEFVEPQSFNMDHIENSGSEQECEQTLKLETGLEMHVVGDLTKDDSLVTSYPAEQTENHQELDPNIDQTDKEQLDSVHADREREDLDFGESTEENMEDGTPEEAAIENETQTLNLDHTENTGLSFDLPEYERGWSLERGRTLEPIMEQSMAGDLTDRDLTDMKPGSKNTLTPALEEQMDLEPTVKENIVLELMRIVQHAEIVQSENRDPLEEQTRDPEISEEQSVHLEWGGLNPSEEQSAEQEIKPDEPPSNPTTETHLNPDTSLEHRVELDTFVEHYSEPDPSSLGLEHFLREMGLIFELTHMSRGSASHKVLRLPSLAVDLLLYGIPLELMDGDASNIPSSWLGHVLAELQRRLPPIGIKVRVLTNLGVHRARNAEVFSALFGVDFPRGQRRLTRGVYMLPLWLPDELRMDMDCDLLIMVDVEGLCSPGLDLKGDTLVHDNEMATIATGLSDVLMHNITSYGCAKFETNQTVIINALLRTEVCGHTPICELLTQDKGLNAKLQAFQLGCVDEILQTEIGETEEQLVMGKSRIPCLIGPWQNTSLSEPVDKEYSKTVIELKQKLFEALTKCASKSEATGLPEFMGRLFAVWEAVKAESFLIGLKNTEVAKAFSVLCTELSLWESIFLGHMESWFAGATMRVIFDNAIVSETGVTVDLLSALKEEARVEVKTDVDQIRSRLEAYLIKDDLHKTYIATYRPNLMSNMNTLQDQVTEKMIEKLESTRENHNSSVRLRGFQSFLEKGQEAKLHALTETSKLANVYPEDTRLEEEFEDVWNNALSNFDFSLPKIDDIPARVTEVLRQNLISRGLQEHMKKLKDIGKDNTSGFIVHEEHFEFHSKLKHIRRQRWLQAHYVVNYILEEYKTFVVGKSNLAVDVSDSYVTEVFENVEEILKKNPLENTSNFEVDLKVYLCSFARQDLQEIHERYTKDSLLAHIKGSKNNSLGRFIYQARKRDQCQRVAHDFTSMVFRKTALDYIYRPMGRRIVEEMVCRDDAQRYLSPQAFNRSLLEELMEEDSFESFLEYLLSYENFSLGKIQKWVAAHLSETTVLEEWTRLRLEEIVGRMNTAVSRTVEDMCGVLSDTKCLLEKVCLDLEKDGDVSVSRDFLDGPLFSITIEWDRFVTCLLEALDEMRQALGQEFSQDVDIMQLLQALPVKPQDCLFNGVRGCDIKCPCCGAPCEVEEVDHEVHRALLHRPKGMLSHTCCDSSLSHNSCPFDVSRDNLHPDWSISPEDPDGHPSNTYWRYVLARFKGRFAEEYSCEPIQLPDGWDTITREEALESLNQAFHTETFM